MAFCPKCGKEVLDEAEICVGCGCRIKPAPTSNSTTRVENDGKNLTRFLLTFFLGFLGSFIINHSSLKPDGWKSRTCAYFFLSCITWGIYPLVASICNFSFDANKQSNIGYFKI